MDLGERFWVKIIGAMRVGAVENKYGPMDMCQTLSLKTQDIMSVRGRNLTRI